MRRARNLGVVLLLSGFVACGGGSGGGGGSTPTAPAADPSAAMTTVGNGALVIHPAAAKASGEAARRDHHHGEAAGWVLETPIRLRETGGGSCEWTAVRLSLISGNQETEQVEIGSEFILGLGYNRVTAHLDTTYRMYFGLHSKDFDSVAITLDFTDHKDGRQFTSTVPYETVAGVRESPEPLGVPHDTTHRLPSPD